MEDKKDKTAVFFMDIITTFSYSMIVMSLAGWLIGDLAKESGGLFALGREGLSYRSIFQIFICSIVLGILRTIFISDLFFNNMMLLWRNILLLLSALLSAGALTAAFKWIPVKSWEAWVGFIVSFIICFLISSSFLIIKTKLDDKKYERLLSDYKSKQKKESGE